MICEGIVLHGKKVGRELGFPTINIINIIDLGPGVYAGYTYFDDLKFSSVIYVGNKRKELIESHLFGFDKDVYGKVVKIEILKKIRDDKNIESIDELKPLINNDVEKVKEFFNYERSNILEK